MGTRDGRALRAQQVGAAPTAGPATLTGKPGVASLPAPATIHFDRDALFLDFDGTLADIAPTPDQVVFSPKARVLLEKLLASFSGAVAIITGRTISDIDRHMAPLQLPVAGLYGMAHRRADQRIYDLPTENASIAQVAKELGDFAGRHPGLLLEHKGQTIALHYRLKPELAMECRAVGQAALNGMRNLKLIEGKMVIEIAPSVADKGRALRDFMQEVPFAGRRPIYCGDDVSDEAAFAAVTALGGIAVKIGAGPSAAPYRADNIAQLLAWLQAVGQAQAKAQ